VPGEVVFVQLGRHVEGRLPAEAVDVEASRLVEVAHAERQQLHPLLHRRAA
jgi:hypothetical protein